MAINWRTVQSNLGVVADGAFLQKSWAALFRRVSALAGATPSQTIMNSLGSSAVIHLPEYGITDSVERLAWLLAETANETGGYATFEENLNYSIKGMMQTWPTHFSLAQAQAAVGKPKDIAIRAYAGRMGNMPIPSTDGWDYRGRGMIQLTGKVNYQAADKRLGIGLDTNPEIAAVPALSLLLACDFYRQNKVMDAVDKGDTTLARKLTNGGAIGLPNVLKLRTAIIDILT